MSMSRDITKTRQRRFGAATSPGSDTPNPKVDNTSPPVPGSVSKLVITERDRQVMSFIGTGGLANLSQLQRLYWPGSSSPYRCRYRLSQLEKAGYLKSWFVDAIKRGELVFTLTKEGAKSQFSEGTRQYFYTSLPPRSELLQQSLAQEARVLLETNLLPARQRQLVRWKNEHQLRGEAWKQLGGLFGQTNRQGKTRGGRLAEIADAQLTLLDKTSGELEVLDLEVDGAYYGQLLDRKLTQLVKKGKPVLWVTTSQSRVDHVKQHLLQVAATNPTQANPQLQVLPEQFQFLVVDKPQ